MTTAQEFVGNAQAEREVQAAEEADAIHVGTTLRFSHNVCGDTRRRGYITRKYRDDSGVIDLFYCHNCGASGYRVPDFVRGTGTTALTAPIPILEPDAGALPHDVVAIRSVDYDLPERVRVWAVNYRVEESALWSPSLGRIVLPIGGIDDSPYAGYQARRPPGTDPRCPKYITVQKPDVPWRMVVKPITTPVFAPRIVVWTEDWVSAHQFVKFDGVYGAPLLGLNVHAENVMWVDKTVRTDRGTVDHPTKHVIWLDNDVKKSFESRDYLSRLLGALGRGVFVMDHSPEPKTLPIETLETRVKHWRDNVFREP